MNDQWIRYLYVEFLGREPTADPDEVALWRDVAPADVAKGLLASAEYRARRIREAYVKHLNRHAQDKDVYYWLSASTTVEEALAGIVGSAECRKRINGR